MMNFRKLKVVDDEYLKMDEGHLNEDKMDGSRIKQLIKENIKSGITVALVSTILSPAVAMA